MGIPYLCCTLLSPLIGLYIDSRGQRIKMLVLSSFLVFVGLLSILFFYPIYSMILIGIAYSFFASTIWTAITFVVAQDKLVLFNNIYNLYIGNCLWSDGIDLKFYILFNSIIYCNNRFRGFINNCGYILFNTIMYDNDFIDICL